jgi:release factor glutamine methyltransferase
MSIATAYRQLSQRLTKIYDEREAQSIASIVFEDIFGIRNINRKEPFSADLLDPVAERLLAGEPVQYVLGKADFYGLKITVTSDTLIPRAETEELVFEILGNHGPHPSRTVLDIGTGTGCIPLVLKHQRPAWHVTGADVSPGALAVAQDNAKQLNLNVMFRLANILEAKDQASLPYYDIIISNPPYIPPSESRLLPSNVLQHEPHLALFTETEDALVFYRTIAQFAAQHLNPQGMLYFELNEFNGDEVLECVESQGFECIELKKDMQGKIRILSAQYPGQ